MDRFSPSVPSVPGRSPSQAEHPNVVENAYGTDEAARIDLMVLGESSRDTPAPEERPATIAEDSMVIDPTDDNDEQAMYVDPVSRTSRENSQGINLDHNPKIKAIKSDMVIPLHAFAARYEQLGGQELFSITLDPEIRDVEVSRDLISRLYGGSNQQAFPRPSKAKIAMHGIADFMCPNYEMHPNAPKFPGAPGFYFTVGNVHAKKSRPWVGVFRLIMKFDGGKWQYLGQYIVVPSESLTKEEWLEQTDVFRNAWVKEIMRGMWATEIRASITLRRRLGPETDLDDSLWPVKTLADEATRDHVLAAFASGEMFISVWGLKCVGYDEEFQRSLVNETTWCRPRAV